MLETFSVLAQQYGGTVVDGFRTNPDYSSHSMPYESTGGFGMNRMMEAAAGGAMVFVTVIYVMILAFLIIYILGYVKGKKEERKDEFLGTKVMLTFFMTICFQAVLAGLACLLVVSSMKHGKAQTEVFLGLMIGGIVAGIYPTVTYFAGVKGRGSFNVGRKALGINAIITGLISTIGLIVFFVVAFKGGKVLELFLFTFIYLGAAIGCGIPLVRSAAMEYVNRELEEEEDGEGAD